MLQLMQRRRQRAETYRAGATEMDTAELNLQIDKTAFFHNGRGKSMDHS